MGFRPFVYRLATELGLRGWVLNSQHGVYIDVEGEKPLLDAFLLRLPAEKPPRSFIQSCESSFLDPAGYDAFVIRESSPEGKPTALVLPDIATCPDCLDEIFNPSNRRYRYPFTNCTNCGPRFSIVESLPYDRPRTTMKSFVMCARCTAEYHDPTDRRFHAQPNACPECGPTVELWDTAGTRLEGGDAALLAAERLIRGGSIVAVKGIGGFHLVVDARNESAVRRLREQKHREEKPLALMFPAATMVRTVCEVSDREERLLCSPETPIVLLSRRERADGETPGWNLAPSIAPHNPYLGIMLPYAPLHHILLHDLGFPVVATSGNLSDEPMCTDEHEALARLAGIADAFLVHNRPITRPIDDAIARVVLGREMILRRARGYAPLPVSITHTVPDMLAVGAQLKSTVAVARGNQVFISQHLGDLETEQSLRAFNHETRSLQQLYEIVPELVVSDLHPDYLSSAYARNTGYPHETVQHHYAHIASCMADNGLDGRVLGVAWDGTGYGLDGTIWGGEFLLTDAQGFRRVATLRSFRLPGGEAAVKEPRRSALGVLYELFGTGLQDREDLLPVRMFDAASRQILLTMLTRTVNTPLTTSVGRLFDAVASLAGVRQISRYEGQAAMELEFAIAGNTSNKAYPWRIVDANVDSGSSFLTVDWEPMVDGILRDIGSGCKSGVIATRFHNTLAGIIVDVARRIGEPRVTLSGGCFQNRYLTECSVRLLEEAGFSVYWHQRVPPNDGGIALGQIYAVARARSQQ